MAGVINIDVKDIEAMQKLMDRAIEVVNPERFLDEIGAVLLNRIRTRFLATEDPDGNKWIESDAALARQETGRAARGLGTLFDTGTLFHSIQLSRSAAKEREIGTDVPYSVVHQFGRFGQEKRVFLGFGTEDNEIAVKLIERRLENL